MMQRSRDLFRRFMPALCLLLGAALALMLTPVASAQTPDVENQVLRIAKNLYCPVCPATPLDVCETQACRQWRDLIREKLIAGENEEQIRAYFIAQYGERVLGAPPPVGFNLGAYVLPLLLLLTGGGVLYFTLRSWMRPRAARAPEIAPLAMGEVAARIARELKERE